MDVAKDKLAGLQQHIVLENLHGGLKMHYISEQIVSEDGTLTAQGKAIAKNGLIVLAQACHKRAVSKGWWDDDAISIDEDHDDGTSTSRLVFTRNFGEMIALMHSELSEALEAYREGDNATKVSYEYDFGDEKEIRPEPIYLVPGHSQYMIGKPVGVASELADVLIRIFDTCAALDIPLAQALLEKHEYNGTRAYRHGGKLC